MKQSPIIANDKYLELLKKVLTGYIFQESADWVMAPKPGKLAFVRNAIIRECAKRNIRLVKSVKFNPRDREEGKDWPSLGFTMVGLKRLDNIQFAIETVIKDGVPGDLCECGVWRGGAAIFMKAVLTHYSERRLVWAADSFSGLPKPNAIQYPADKGWDFSQVDYLSVPLEMVKNNFLTFGMLDDRVVF